MEVEVEGGPERRASRAQSRKFEGEACAVLQSVLWLLANLLNISSGSRTLSLTFQRNQGDKQDDFRFTDEDPSVIK